MSLLVLSRRLALSEPANAAVKVFSRTMATKKQGGSTSNGRDSAGRRLGIKLYPGQIAKAGSIIVRQRGQKFRAEDNVGMGKDHTIFAKQEGVVKMTRLPTNTIGPSGLSCSCSQGSSPVWLSTFCRWHKHLVVSAFYQVWSFCN